MKYTTIEDIKRWRRHIHQNPELSQKENQTAEYIREELKKMGLDYTTPLPTATIVEFNSNSKETILLRADIDALPITEANDVDYKSNNCGIMHACGHDAHTAMLLGACKEINEIHKKGNLNINVLCVFQPAEESFGGADQLIQKYDFSKHNIISSFAVHVNPDFNEGEIVSRIGAIMASCNEFGITVKGKSAHVGIRENGINAMNAVNVMYNQIQQIPTFDLDSKHTNIIHIGLVRVGEVLNSVPENGFMEGTIRTYNMDDLQIIKNRMKEIVKGAEVSTKCKIDLDLRDGYPAVLNDEELLSIVESAATKSGAKFIMKKDPYLLGEDFSFFKDVSKINYSFVGIRNEELGYTSGLHTPTLMMREEALIYGVDYFVNLVLEYS